MKHAYIFPGQGSQFIGMGKDLYENNPSARALFDKANTILGFRITDTLFQGTDEELKQTRITQPAIFIHSVAAYSTIQQPNPDMVAGHSLGEFSALVANGTLTFEDALKLVSIRANAMQQACETTPPLWLPFSLWQMKKLKVFVTRYPQKPVKWLYLPIIIVRVNW